MELFVVRHGESIGNTKSGYLPGRSDPDGLTFRGRVQIMRSAWEIGSHSFDFIVSSPVVRARETSFILSSLLDVSVYVEDYFSELDHGTFEQKYWWELREMIPEGWQEHGMRENFSTPYPEGESFEMMLERVQSGLVSLQKKYGSSNMRILLVSHMAPVAAISYLAKKGLSSDFQSNSAQEDFMRYLHDFRIVNGGILKINLDSESVELSDFFNQYSHVEPTNKSVSFYTKEAFCKYAVDFTHVSSTSENEVFLPKEKERFIFKLIKEENVFFNRLVDRYAFLAQEKIPAPKTLFSDASRAFFDSAVLIQDYVEGEELAKILTHSELNTHTIFSNIFSLTSSIHKIKKKDVSSFWSIEDTPWDAYLLSEMSAILNRLPEFDISDDQREKIIFLFKDLQKYVQSSSYSLVPLHGDLSPSNIIVGETGRHFGVLRLLDFERTRFGDSLWDHVYLYGWCERLSGARAEEFRNLIWKKLTAQQKKVWEYYRVLFHAWSVRDMFEYEGHSAREKVGAQSLRILQNHL